MISNIPTAKIGSNHIGGFKPWFHRIERLIMHRILSRIAVLIFLSGGSRVFPQSGPGAVQFGPVKVQGSVRTRVEAWSWFQGPGDENTYAFPGTLFRLSFSQNRQTLDWEFELAAPVLLNLPSNAVAPAPQGQLGLGASYYAANHNSQNAAFIFPKQAFLRFDQLGGSKHQTLQLGRFEFMDGGEIFPHDPTLAAVKRDRILQRLIGPFVFSDVQRSFDGFHYVNSKPDLNFTIVGAIPTRGVFQTDGWGWVDTPFAYMSLTGQVRANGKNPAEWRLFGIYYDEMRHVLKTDNRPLSLRQNDFADIRLGTVGGHYLQALATPAGTVDFMGWGALQFGRWGALDDRAGAATSEAGIQPEILRALRPWLRAGYFYGSGDGNPADNKHGTFFQILPTTRPYARFPFFNLMNNEDGFGELILRPGKLVTIRSDVHSLRLTNRNDLWYVGGGAFQPWTFGYTGRPSSGARSLASLFDTSVDFKLTSRAMIGLYYGYAKGKSVIRHIYPSNPNGHLAFLETNYSF